MSTFDLAVRFISETTGSSVASDVEKSANRHLGSTPPPFASTPARVPSAVRRATAIMEQTVETPLAIPEIAKRAGVSQRSLTRAFATALGVSAARFYLDLRLARANELLRQSSHSVLDVATMTGFRSASQFSQAFRQRFGLSPSEARKQMSWLAVPHGSAARARLIRTAPDEISGCG